MDDLNFRLEELTIVSGDQLEKVAMRDDGEVEEVKRELIAEQEKSARLQSKWEKKEKKKNLWRCGGSIPGPSACKADALPLSYIPKYVIN